MFGIRTIAINKIASVISSIFAKFNILNLTGDSVSNKGTNTGFFDRSVNDATVTRGGDATQATSSFSPFTAGGSYYFDGTGDYLTLPASTNLDMGSGDFTVEFWLYRSADVASQHLIAQQAAGFTVQFNGAGSSNQLIVYDGSIRIIGNISLNTWTHFALVRSGSTLQGYINGVAAGSPWSNLSSTVFTLNGGIIGSRWGATNGFNGHISNLRIVKGTALYTGNFTPSATALTNVVNTSLLTCHAPRLFDASINNFNITVSGNTSYSSFTPFDKTELSGSAGGYSVYLSGTSNYLTTAYNTALNIGTSDFTIECWFWPTVLSGTKGLLGNHPSLTGGGVGIYLSGSTPVGQVFANGSSSASSANGPALSVNTWNHIAFVRSSGTIKVYTNGVAGAGVSAAANPNNISPFYIGAYEGTTYIAPASYFSDVRVVVGTAIYTSNFAPPTSPLTAISGTAVLTCNSASYADSSVNDATVTVSGSGNKISGFNPFGSGSGWSAFFDGVNDYVSKAGSGVLTTNGDVTIECWICPSSTTVDALFDGGPGQTQILRNYPANVISKQGQEASGASFSVRANVWQHFACTFSAGSIKVYINGVLSGSGSYTTGYSGGSNFYIGSVNGSTTFYRGNISDFRVTRSIVYSSNFTPPTGPLTALAATSLLTLQSNSPTGFVDNSSNAYALSPLNGAAMRAVGPFSQPNVWSGFFDGTGDMLTVTNLPGPLTGDFTYECWVFPTSTAVSYRVIFGIDNYTGTTPFRVYQYGTNLQFWYTGTNNIAATGITANTWYHVAITRSSGVLRLFVNGIQAGSNITSTLNYPTSNFRIGMDSAGTYPFVGFISNLRAVNGTALYTSNFIPSTSPLSAVAGTSLLTLQDNAFRDNSSNAFAITRAGNVEMQPQGPFAASYPAATSLFPGSVYFDGTNDYLTIPASAATNVFGGDFTIEMWFCPVSLNGSGYNYLMFQDDGASNGMNFQLVCTAAGLVAFTPNSSSGRGFFSVVSTRAVKLGAWNHIAATHVKSSNTTRLFLNGALEATDTTAIWAGASVQTCLGNFSAGGFQGTTYSKLNGYMSGVRMIKGTALYTSAFVPPTSPPIATANTALLLNFNDGAITDNYGTNSAAIYQTAGNVSSNIATKKNGTGSLYFDGSGDYILMAGQPEYAFGSGDFTIECWVNPAAFGSIIYDSRPSSTEGAYVALYLNNDGTVNLVNNGAIRITTTAVVANTWNHIALVRSGGISKIYLNGTQSGSSYADSTVYLNGVNRPIIGAYGFNPSSLQFNGYMDDIRVYRGYAKYTGPFVPI